MNAQEYYRRVTGRMETCFEFAHYVVASGREVAGESDDPLFPCIAQPTNRLKELTENRGLQVNIPVIGDHSRAVLMPIDIEIFMGDENWTLYTDPEAQNALFKEAVPLLRFIEDIFRSRGMPYLFDYTPSGGHLLFQNVLGYRATEAVRQIGFVEADLLNACRYIDPHDIRRWHSIEPEAAAVFSGLGKLAEYIALLAMEHFRDNEANGRLPVTVSDCTDRCLNIDNTWNEGAPFMRCIRSPFSLHKKNQDKYDRMDQPPLVDVIGTLFDGKTAKGTTDIDHVTDCMWDLEKAADHAQNFSGHIPCSNETLIDFIEEYKQSDLYIFHQEFEAEHELPRGRAIDGALRESNIHGPTRQILQQPNPAALQPKNMIDLVSDFLINAHWPPRHIANILRDLYQNPTFGWTQDFFKNPSDEKANFWARTYSSVALWKTGGLHV